MTTFQYRGFVLPAERPLTLEYGPHVERAAIADEPSAIFRLRIVEGQVTVTVELETFNDSVGIALCFAANDIARSSVEFASFATGVAHLVVLNECLRPDGSSMPLILADNKLGEVCQAFSMKNLEEVTDLVLQEIDLARVLSDAVMMLSWAHYSPIAGGRVADSLVRMVAGGRTAKHWEQMHQILRVDRAYIQLLSDHSAPPRHGHRVAVPGEITAEIARRAWTLLNRYFAYRLKGSAPLPPDVYPLLKGYSR